MAQRGRPRAGTGRTSRPQRAWYAQLPTRKKGAPAKRSDNWVGSSLLTAMDRMEEHVDEMLSTNIGSGQTAASQAVSAVDTALIKQEITRRLEEKISSLIDKATSSARLDRMESMQKLDRTNIQSLQTSYDYERRTIDDLDALHRHERLLNSALVERLFQVSALEGSIDSDAMFDKTTFGLQGTDSVNSMLVSCVEKLILKVETLERKVKAMERCLVKKEE